MEVVSTFETDSYLSVCQGHEHMGHVRIASRCDPASPKVISSGCVESSGNDDEIWVELLSDWHDDSLERCHILAVANTLLRPADIDILADALTNNDLVEAAIWKVSIFWLAGIKFSVRVDVKKYI